MSKLIEFFKNRIVISILGLIVLSLLIWFVGPAIKFGESNAAPLGSAISRLVLIMIILVAWGLNNLRVQMHDKKQNEDLVDDLKDNQINNATSEQTQEEMHLMSERFTQALSTLKKLKFKGRGNKKALYELPWYIIIGPPGSGKTTALINSTLDFPLAEQFGKGALQGVGGTRNCDWWFTNDAVLIDTAGRYTTQDSHKVVDSSAWEGFLNLLKRNRRRRPINGAIVAISLLDLLSQTDEDRIMHAKTIRSRIDELMDKLEIRFPIYLMFTKTDLVSGFSEFFEDLGKEDREQVWGISLPNAPKVSQSPDFEYLEGEYNKLFERIYDRVLWRIHQERDIVRRGAIQGFPQQMENIKAIIDSFIKQTFVKNRYQFQPYLRGMYFTSGTQDGTPIDRMMTSVSANFGFSADVVQQPNQQGKSFFIGQLFRHVIFPESELVGSNRKYETFIRWLQRASYAGFAGITLIMFVVWAGSFTRNEMYMHEVQEYIAEYKAEKKRLNNWSSDLRTVLPTLNALGKASIVYNQEEHPWLSGMGMYDGNVDSAADTAYETQLKTLLLPRLLSYIESFLQKGHQGGDLYNTFRTYLMFQKVEHMDKQLISDWFKTNWQSQLHGEASKRKELEIHLAALLDLELSPATLKPNLVTATRSLLLRVPVSNRIYSRVKTNPKYSLNINLINEFGETVRNSFINNPKVNHNFQTPLMFTLEGYENIDLSANSEVIANIVNERWVLSDDKTAKVDFVKSDLEEISNKVKDHYLSDYKQHWNNVYNALEVTSFKSLKNANEILASFTDPVYSPLISILQIGATNTQLSSQVFANMADDNDKGVSGKLAGFAAAKTKWTKVDKEFRSLNVLMRDAKNMPAPINGIIAKVQQLYEFVNEIAVSPDPTKMSFEIAKARYNSGAGNAITSLKAYAKNTPQPVKRWLDTLANETWKIILQSAHQYVNSEWKSQIHEPYMRGLAGRYPIKRSSSDELALFDFTEFFKPEGTIDKFYTVYMKPFVNTRSSQWTSRIIDNYSIGFSTATLSQLQRSQSIKDIFFRSNPAMPSLSFQLKPHKMDKTDARFTLEVGNKSIAYSHGPKFWKTLNWIGDDEHNRVRIIFEDLEERQHAKDFDGPWAWFRLQDHSVLKKTSKSNVYLVTYNLNKEKAVKTQDIAHAVTYQIKAKSVNNPFSENLLGSFNCPESI
ncbi:MAG: type VI secretion system membrane subunit TssM [Gammaproteobacteria bacterium]|nr:type VI secretion system membrane subunit TssM [Gammaproteobacteria bacterium]MCW8987125.1 type VI secretion system membrane subunit TssM [Gammaproteobacteria bacterium]